MDQTELHENDDGRSRRSVSDPLEDHQKTDKDVNQEGGGIDEHITDDENEDKDTSEHDYDNNGKGNVYELSSKHSIVGVSSNVKEEDAAGDTTLEINEEDAIGDATLETMEEDVIGDATLEIKEEVVIGDTTLEIKEEDAIGDATLETMEEDVIGDATLETMEEDVIGDTTLETTGEDVIGDSTLETTDSSHSSGTKSRSESAITNGSGDINDDIKYNKFVNSNGTESTVSGDMDSKETEISNHSSKTNSEVSEERTNNESKNSNHPSNPCSEVSGEFNSFETETSNRPSNPGSEVGGVGNSNEYLLTSASDDSGSGINNDVQRNEEKVMNSLGNTDSEEGGYASRSESATADNMVTDQPVGSEDMVTNDSTGASVSRKDNSPADEQLATRGSWTMNSDVSIKSTDDDRPDINEAYGSVKNSSVSSDRRSNEITMASEHVTETTAYDKVGESSMTSSADDMILPTKSFEYETKSAISSSAVAEGSLANKPDEMDEPHATTVSDDDCISMIASSNPAESAVTRGDGDADDDCISVIASSNPAESAVAAGDGVENSEDMEIDASALTETPPDDSAPPKKQDVDSSNEISLKRHEESVDATFTESSSSKEPRSNERKEEHLLITASDNDDLLKIKDNQSVLIEALNDKITEFDEARDQLSSMSLDDYLRNSNILCNNMKEATNLMQSYGSFLNSAYTSIEAFVQIASEVSSQLDAKVNQDLSSWTNKDDRDHLTLKEEREATLRAAESRAADATQNVAEAIELTARAREAAVEAGKAAADAAAVALKASTAAEGAMTRDRELREAAERKRRAEEEERRVALERARQKASEEQLHKEEEERRLVVEAAARGTSIEDERQREAEEIAQKETERRDPRNWPRYIYTIEAEEFNPGIGCIVRSMEGCLSREDVLCQSVDQRDDILVLNDNEELVSNIIELSYRDPNVQLTLEEPVSLVIPHYAPRGHAGRETVIKMLRTGGKWEQVLTKDIMFDDIKDIRLVEARVKKFGIFAVVQKLKTEHHTLSSKGGKIMSSVDPRVTMTTKVGTVRASAKCDIEIQPVDSGTVHDLRLHHPVDCGQILTSSPIVHFLIQNKKFYQPLAVTIPCPHSPHQRAKRPTTAIAREPAAPSSLRPSTARPAIAVTSTKTDDDHPDDMLHLITRQSRGDWSKQLNVKLLQSKTKDSVTFDIIEPFERFVIIRTKLGVPLSAVEKMARLLEGSLNHQEAQILLRQNRDDPNSVEMVCGTPSKIDKEVKKHLDADEDDVTFSKTMFLREGKVLSVQFRGNILCRSEDVDLRLAFNSHVLSRIRFDVQEIDKFAQKSINCYRGFIQMFTTGFIPKRVPPTDDNSREKSRASVAIKAPQFIYISGNILLSELLVSLPKPCPEPPRPLSSAPVVIRSDGPITEGSLLEISKELGDEWRRVAHILNVKRVRIQSILRQNISKDNHQVVYDMLLAWAKKTPTSVNKVTMLCSALEISGRPDLSSKLRDSDVSFRRTRARSAKGSYLRKAFIKIAQNAMVVNDWQFLGKKLGISDEDIKYIQNNSPTVQEKCYSALERWREVQGEEATLRLLSDKLRVCNYRRLAKDIETFGQPLTV